MDLHHLEGLEAAGKLNVFELVEQCAADDDAMVRVATSGVCSDIECYSGKRQMQDLGGR